MLYLPLIITMSAIITQWHLRPHARQERVMLTNNAIFSSRKLLEKKSDKWKLKQLGK